MLNIINASPLLKTCNCFAAALTLICAVGLIVRRYRKTHFIHTLQTDSNCYHDCVGQ